MLGGGNLIDPYSRRAHFFPGLIVALPLTALIVVLIPAPPAWWTALQGLLVGSGLTYLGAQLARWAGKRREPDLWTSWGGAPTLHLLRFRTAANRVATERRHDLLQRLLPDLPLPNAESERRDPSHADEVYATATTALIERTRAEKNFPRVFDENCQYGFRRNLWACKPLGVLLAAISLVLVLVVTILEVTRRIDVAGSLELGVAAVLNIVILAILVSVVTPMWVREAGDAYAERLFGALEQLVM